jgi:L,D-transpeptidase catalytic domain
MKLTPWLRTSALVLAALPVFLVTGPHSNIAQVSEADAAPGIAANTAPAVSRPASRVTAALPDVQGLSPKVLAMALDAVSCAKARGASASKEDLLTIIDYSLPSNEPRLWVLDLAHGKVLFHELVAHGAGSGDVYATRFSNTNDSRQTSLGLFRTAGTYEGGNGYSLVLRGLDAGVNDRAEARHIVMHGAWYVSPEHARQHGRIGRSWGCPALSEKSAHKVIDTIKGGSYIFSYSADKAWTTTASHQSCPAPQNPSAPTASGTTVTAASR